MYEKDKKYGRQWIQSEVIFICLGCPRLQQSDINRIDIQIIFNLELEIQMKNFNLCC